MTSPSPKAQEILDALADNKNVVLTGPPAVGKTHLMQEVAAAFGATATTATSTTPQSATGPIGIPAAITTPGTTGNLPSPSRTKRHVERIAFSANTKQRDFTSAFVPLVDSDNALNGLSFRVESGALIKANEAALDNAAVLLIIDELNRGPAVQLFGDGIVAIEPSKRLLPNDDVGPDSFPMRVLDENGNGAAVHLSNHLYILCSMNQADTSIEPLDVAFLRRFHPIQILPDYAIARSHLNAVGAEAALPADPASAGEVMEALVRAWSAVNKRIADGRSEDFQIGHGVFMDRPAPSDVASALRSAAAWWKRVYAHAVEVFFGDTIGTGVVLNAGNEPEGYQITATSFGDDEREKIVAPSIDGQTIYGLLRRVSAS